MPLEYSFQAFPGSSAIAPPGSPGGAFALEFPQNNGRGSTDPVVVIKFANPQDNGFPIDGPSGQGITMVRRVWLSAQNAASNGTKYTSQWWWANMAGFITSGNIFLWNDGSQGYNVGLHPYPYQGNTISAWAHEIAANAQDVFLRDSDSSAFVITTGQWVLQGARIIRNPDTTLSVIYYPNLPNVDSANRITFTSPAGYAQGTPLPPNPGFFIGDSMWYQDYQHESGAFRQGQIKNIAKDIGEAGMVAESEDFSRMVTADGQTWNWWSKNGFDSLDDLTDDFGSGITLVWHDPTAKASLVSIA